LNPPEAPHHFDEPWQAQAFALAVGLVEAGVFSWADWTGALSAAVAQIEGDGGVIDGRTYPEAWLTALEALTIERGALDPRAVSLRAAAWREAYLTTPHGQPVALGSEPAW
jgi:nitrile hydratase accessory protein